MEYSGAITLLWKLGDKILKRANRAQLIVTELNAQDFRPSIESGSYSRFIIAKVTNYGGSTASNCLAHMIIDDAKNEFKLHWCGESWEYQRDSAPKINLEPSESRDLDIAFSTCGHMTTPPQSGGMNVTLPPIYPDSSSGKKGAWIATPAVTKNFEPDSPTYLIPGCHSVEVRIVLGEGSGFTTSFDVISTEDPSELIIDVDSVKYRD